MASGYIPFTSIPGWPTPLAGAREAMDATLAAANFDVSHSDNNGLWVGDVTTAQNSLSSYVGSAAQLAWNQNLQQEALATLYGSKFVAGFNYNTENFQIDPASQSNIASMGSLAAAVVNNTPGALAWPSSFFWIASNNSQVPMTAAQMYAFSQAVASYVSALVVNNFSLKQSIAAAATMTALQAINITSGWPTN